MRIEEDEKTQAKYLLLSPTFYLISLSGLIIMLGYFTPFQFLPGKGKVVMFIWIALDVFNVIFVAEKGAAILQSSSQMEHPSSKETEPPVEIGYLLSYLGLSNTIGRIAFGLIANHPKMNPLILTNFWVTVGGIATMLCPLATQYYQLQIYAVIFGLSIGKIVLLLQFDLTARSTLNTETLCFVL